MWNKSKFRSLVTGIEQAVSLVPLDSQQSLSKQAHATHGQDIQDYGHIRGQSIGLTVQESSPKDGEKV